MDSTMQSQPAMEDIARKFQNACEIGDVKTLRSILTSGQFYVDNPLELKWSGLQHACYNGKKEAVKYLLAKGADPKFKRCGDGMNVLHVVACSPFPENFGAYDCCNIILGAGGKVSDTMERNITPLIFAVKRCHHRMVKLFLEKGSDINHQDDSTRNALDWACLKGYIEIVEILLNHGADVTMKNKHGWTAEEVAYYEGHEDIVELFETFFASNSVVRSPTVFVETVGESQDNPREMIRKYKQIKTNQRSRLNLVLNIEGMGKCIDWFQKRHINYSRFLKMTEEDLKGIGITDFEDRASLLKLIKKLNLGVKQPPKSCSSDTPLSYKEVTKMLTNMEDHLLLMTKKYDEMKRAVEEDPSILQRGNEMALLMDFKLAIQQLNTTMNEFAGSVKIFKETRVPRKQASPQPRLDVEEKNFASLGHTPGRAVLKLSALAGIMVTLTFIAKTFSK